jgi:phosphate transport system substrate-binding protein
MYTHRASRLRPAAAIAASLAALALPVLALADASALQGAVRIAGSSTVGPITMAVAEEFNERHPAVRVQNAVTGTGGGFKRFCAGETDISNASRPIKPSEIRAAEENRISYFELPVAFDGLTIVVNPSNTWADRLSVEQLEALFRDGSTIDSWNDLDPDWPDRPIKMFIPGTDSGTFDYFKEVVVGDEGSVRGDLTVSEDDNILVKGVAGDTNAIGFFGCAYYFANLDKLRAVPIINDQGEAVEPTHDSIESGQYNPFSRPLFIYVNEKSARRPEVQAFVEFYFRHGGRLAEEVGYVQMPRRLSFRAMRKFKTGETGTHYHDEQGQPIRGGVVEVYDREPFQH